MSDERFSEEDEQDDEQDLFEHFSITADKGQELLRVDKFLQNRLEKTSRSRIQAAADAGNIHVNGKAVKSNYRVKPADYIAVVFAHPPRDREIKPENIPLNIVYEDEEVIVINKPPGLVVHPGHGNYSGTLVNALMYHFRHLDMYRQKESPRPGLVHRLDKNTSGIMVLAKTEYSMTHLARQFFERTTKRTYQALVWGDVKEDSGTITGHIGRDVRDRKLFTVYPGGDQGKHAVTHYNVLERFGYVTLVECRLETGRTHQIRVHLKYIGHPLFNDDTYGGDKILKGTTFSNYKQFVDNCFEILPRHALHAKSLGFVHPVSKKELFFDSELPDDMTQAILKWRTYFEFKISKAE
ncbi:MAG: RluA family pseudouridine synthase [Bacteroidetes bacterium]|nr:RluA family pseudouridine synthase [Bacteroidota bacterium]